MTKKAKAYAERYGTVEMWEEAKKKYPPFYHMNGFDEPDLPVITNQEPDQVQFFQWGFVPLVYAPSIHGRPMNTLNARDDKIFTEKSIYRKSAESSRCLVMLDGFFDHHKKNGVLDYSWHYPFIFISIKTGSLMKLIRLVKFIFKRFLD